MRALVVNRMHPRFGDGLARGARASGPAPSRAPTLGGLYRNLADFQLVAAREEEHLAGLAEQVAPAPVVRVPFLRPTSTTSTASTRSARTCSPS